MPRRPPDRPFAAPRSRPWLPTWRAMLVGLIVAATAVLALVRVPVHAQDTDEPAAWWARVNEVDAATECGAQAAWVRAMDAEDQAEHDLTADPLPAVLDGPELARESHVVRRLEEQGHGLARIEFQEWRVMGGSADELVLYMSYTGRLGFLDAESAGSRGHRPTAGPGHRVHDRRPRRQSPPLLHQHTPICRRGRGDPPPGARGRAVEDLRRPRLIRSDDPDGAVHVNGCSTTADTRQ